MINYNYHFRIIVIELVALEHRKLKKKKSETIGEKKRIQIKPAHRSLQKENLCVIGTRFLLIFSLLSMEQH